MCDGVVQHALNRWYFILHINQVWQIRVEFLYTRQSNHRPNVDDWGGNMEIESARDVRSRIFAPRDTVRECPALP